MSELTTFATWPLAVAAFCMNVVVGGGSGAVTRRTWVGPVGVKLKINPTLSVQLL
jgi:hypothetical protein